jgi:hypothetical protein
MQTIQLIQITPDELKNLISEAVKQTMYEICQSKPIASKPEDNDYITRIEASTFLKVSLVTIHDWSKKGLLKHYKLGNRTYYKKSEIIQKINNSNKR